MKPVKFLRRLGRHTRSYQMHERSRSMTSMARKVSTRVEEVVVAVELISALTSSRVEEEDLAFSKPTTFSDNFSAEKIHLLTSLTTIPSQRLAAMAVRRNNQTNIREEDSKPLVRWVEVSSTMTTSLVVASEAASEAGQCSSRCNRLVGEAADISRCSSRALVEWAWAAAWANRCQHKPTSRTASESLEPKQAQLMLKAIDQLRLKKRLMMVVET